MIYNAVFKNRYVRHFLDAAPGLVELLTIGKIWALTQPKGTEGNRQNFRRVIVDAPSTGHGLSLLTVPDVVARAVRVGPLKTKSQQILEVLRDPNQCNVWLATLPEELPVTETVEMVDKLIEQVKVPLGPVMVNSLWPDILGGTAEKELEKLADHGVLDTYKKRRALSRFYLDKLKTQLPQREFVELPLVYSTTRPLEIAKILGKKIKEQVEKC
jgi:anion-transporting  ArsA/GET3 family ATPase